MKETDHVQEYLPPTITELDVDKTEVRMLKDQMTRIQKQVDELEAKIKANKYMDSLFPLYMLSNGDMNTVIRAANQRTASMYCSQSTYPYTYYKSIEIEFEDIEECTVAEERRQQEEQEREEQKQQKIEELERELRRLKATDEDEDKDNM